MAELLGMLEKSPGTRAIRNHPSGKISIYYRDIGKSLVFEKLHFKGLCMHKTGVKPVD